MSMPCPVCQQYHDHNIMTHIYELEEHVKLLILRLDELEKEVKGD